MTNQPIWNLSFVFKNPECPNGIGCYLSNLNELANQLPVLVILILEIVVLLNVLIQRGNDPIKSVMAVSFVNLLITTLLWIGGFLSDKYTIATMSILAISGAIAVYQDKAGK